MNDYIIQTKEIEKFGTGKNNESGRSVNPEGRINAVLKSYR